VFQSLQQLQISANFLNVFLLKIKAHRNQTRRQKKWEEIVCVATRKQIGVKRVERKSWHL
jgi:hypothetical protein